MSENTKADPIKVLFQTEVVDLEDGSTLEVRPLSLDKLPFVLESLSTLMSYVDKGAGPSEVASKGFKEVLELLPHCLNRPPNEVPIDVVPDIVDIVINQNLKDASIKKWSSLTDKLIALGEKVRGMGSSPSS